MSVRMPDNRFLLVTRHAVQRWSQRIEPEVSGGRGVPYIEAELSKAILVPNSLVRRFYPTSTIRRHLRYYGTSKALFVVQSNGKVMTVYPFSEDGLFCVLIWSVMDCLPTDIPCWSQGFLGS